MSSPFVGQIMLFGGQFAPKDWAFCQGQILPINQYQALFALLGTMYGGNGQTTFALPDLRGRAPIGFGQGPGLTNYTQGQTAGVENVTLTVQQMPTHNHLLNADASAGSVASPSGGNLAQTTVPRYSSGTPETYTTGTPAAPVQLAPTTVGVQGGSQSHTNIQPVVAMNYIIALQGIYPSRN